MIIEWKDSLDIGVPEIDTEHRYLVALINNIHQKFQTNELDANLPKVFADLIRYADKHFKNEEALMKAAHYPLLQEHRISHEELADKASDLSEMFLSGKSNLSMEVLDFLKKWLIDHVMLEDKKIGNYIDENGLEVDWDYTPAYEETDSNVFKKCTSCGKTWRTVEDLSKDKDKTVLRPMIDKSNNFFTLIMFNCSCDSTLAIQLNNFVGVSSIPFSLEERAGSENKPSYCSNSGKSSPCLKRCACAYTEKIINYLKNS